MHTLLSRFCEEFVRTVRSVLDPLDRLADVIAEAPDNVLPLQEHLVDLRHQIELLADKVAGQQAYVLIFGPLKSGKSTLMNAISASYVSEVSSLPAYPCMVFVSHGRRHEYTVTHYSGAAQVFDDAAALKDYVNAAHSELASRIRQNESAGTDFDPPHNYKSAIRRVDVKLPIPVLEPSKAVLVDTPGLYTRMKFGYDRMTRDFRNAAACAVFVVRSDNLFLDQVFVEFEKLLELFSKIFLVVNLDTRKHDLGPDGTLVPSLEQTDPARVVEAFETLTMSAPLKKAASDGRLRIHPVDLLEAASHRLGGPSKTARGNGKGTAPTQRARQDEVTGQSSGTSADEPRSGFDRFFSDLTEYLNSTDYVVSFLGDSLQRATTLLGEVQAVCESEDVQNVGRRTEQLEKECDRTGEQARTASRLAASDWKKGLDWLKDDTERVLRHLARDLDAKTSRELSQTLARWYETDDSLDRLVQRDLIPLLNRYQEELVDALSKELSERLVGGHAAIRVSDEVDRMLQDVRVDLGRVGRRAHLATSRDSLFAIPPAPLRSEEIAVRRSPIDWLLVRSRSAVRRRLFGPPEAPSRSIPAEKKALRFPEGCRAEIQRQLRNFEREFFAWTIERVHAQFLGEYCELVHKALNRELRDSKEVFEKRHERLVDELANHHRLREPLVELANETRKALQSVQSLADHYGETDLFLLTKPVLPEYPLPRNVDKGKKGEPQTESTSQDESVLPRR